MSMRTKLGIRTSDDTDTAVLQQKLDALAIGVGMLYRVSKYEADVSLGLELLTAEYCTENTDCVGECHVLQHVAVDDDGKLGQDTTSN